MYFLSENVWRAWLDVPSNYMWKTSAIVRAYGIMNAMGFDYYNVTFDGCGSTLVMARTPDDAVSYGRQFAEIGRTNVRITTPDARSFTLEEVDAALAARKGAGR